MNFGPRWVTCPHCGQKWDSSNRYTSPANHERDRRWWKDEHLSGACNVGEDTDDHTDSKD